MKDLIKSPLGRPLDPAYPSNMFAIAGSIALAALFAAAELIGVAALASPFWVAGGAGFMAWAIGRELDPDNPLSAAVALVMAGALSFVVQPSLFLAAGVLIATRVMAQTVGLALRPLETATLVGGAGFLAGSGIAAAAVPALVATVWIRIGVRPGLLAGGISTVVFFVLGSSVEWVSAGVLAIVLASVSVLSTLVTVPASPPVALADFGDEPIPVEGVSLARLAPIGTILASFLLAGGAGIEAAMIVVASGAAVATIKIVGSQDPKTQASEIVGVGTE